MWSASARAHVHTSFAQWRLLGRSSITDQGVILVIPYLHWFALLSAVCAAMCWPCTMWHNNALSTQGKIGGSSLQPPKWLTSENNLTRPWPPQLVLRSYAPVRVTWCHPLSFLQAWTGTRSDEGARFSGKDFPIFTRTEGDMMNPIYFLVEVDLLMIY